MYEIASIGAVIGAVVFGVLLNQFQIEKLHKSIDHLHDTLSADLTRARCELRQSAVIEESPLR
jgi:hypothetical protein